MSLLNPDHLSHLMNNINFYGTETCKSCKGTHNYLWVMNWQENDIYFAELDDGTPTQIYHLEINKCRENKFNFYEIDGHMKLTYDSPPQNALKT